MSEKNFIETCLDNFAPLEIVKDASDYPFAVVRQGQTLASLGGFNSAPVRIENGVEFSEAGGFVNYVNKFGTENCALFANTKKITACLDYHAGPDKPSWNTHRAYYELRRHWDWSRWSEDRERRMTQRDLILFLEQVKHTIRTPAAGDVLQVIKGLSATSSNSYVSIINDDGESTCVEYKRNANLTSSSGVDIPKSLTIAIPAYDGTSGLPGGDTLYQMEVRLFCRVEPSNSAISFHYSILNFEKAEDMAFRDLVAAIVKETSCDVYAGGRF